MNTRRVPALIMLLGCAVRCIIGLINEEEFSISYVFSLLFVLIVFYIIGLVVKFIFDKHIPIKDDLEVVEESEESDSENKELENIQENDRVEEVDRNPDGDELSN